MFSWKKQMKKLFGNNSDINFVRLNKEIWSKIKIKDKTR